MIESICTALYLFTKPEDLDNYNQGKLSSTKTLSQAKKVIPMLGRLYGYFTEEFAHLGSIQRKLGTVFVFKDKEDPGALVNLCFIKLATNLLYIATELVFYDQAQRHRYWKRISPGIFEYDPSEKERSWQQEFLQNILNIVKT